MRVPTLDHCFASTTGDSERHVQQIDQLLLTTGIQLCLAHYCDLHGPTPLMVTEGLPVPCTTCFDHEPSTIGTADDRPQTSQVPVTGTQTTVAISEALRKMNLNSLRSSSVPASEQEAQSQRAALLRASAASPPQATLSAIETPPDSPHRAPDPQPRRESTFRRTYDDYVTKRASPCDNCALTVPPDQEVPKGKSEPRSDRGPTLRTRAPYARVYGAGGQVSPPTSQASTASDTDCEEQQPPPRYHRRGPSLASRSSMSSTSRLPSHTHYLDYTSTHEPVLPSSFSIVRASCLRTLSLETLPRTPTAATPNASPQFASAPSFVTTHSTGAAASGGPIFFGDPLAGYTTAYIFRIPDVHARGHKRVYAFLALSTHRERQTMKTFGFIDAAFRELAAWIQQLAEAEAEKAAEASPIGGVNSHGNFPPPTTQDRDANDRAGSSFLAGGGGFTRRMGAGGGGVSLRARGLPELVGLPGFFIDLHGKFVRLLLELGVMLSS